MVLWSVPLVTIVFETVKDMIYSLPANAIN